MPLMTAYLTDEIQVGDLGGVSRWRLHGQTLPCQCDYEFLAGCDGYKEAGTRFSENARDRYAASSGEVTNPDVDIFDREAIFIRDVLKPLINEFSGLKVVLDITTQQSVDFIRSMEGVGRSPLII